MTLISAPAGYGKTTTLSEWVDQIGLPVAWISLDEGDNDINQFLTYVVAALQIYEIGLGDMALTLLTDPESPSSRNALTSLLNEVAASSKEMFLVLDDYSQITVDPIHEAVTFILDHLPQNLHLVVSTRSDPPLRLAKMRGRGDLSEIRVDDLRFTQDETRSYLKLALGFEIESEDAIRLTNKTEGWIAGLQLAGLSLQNHPDPSSFIRTYAGDDRYLMDYLMDEVLSNQTEEVQDFLLRTSILTRMSAPLCDAILGCEDGRSQVLLDRITEDNLFVVPLDNRDEWFRYHHLFASLLQHRLKTRTYLDISKLYQRASLWFESQNLINEALRYAIMADNSERISSIIGKYLIVVARSADQLALIRWVDSQPEDVLKANPWLCIGMAWALNDTGQMKKMERFIKLAETSWKHSDRQACYIAAICANRASMLGDIEQMINYALEAQALIHPEDSKIRGLITLLLSKGAFWKGNLPRSVELLQASYSDNLTAGDYNRAVLNLTDAGAIQVVMGNVRNGLNTLHGALDLAGEIKRSSGRRSIASAYTFLTLGDVSIELGELEKARKHIQRGLHLAELWGQPEIHMIGYEYLSRTLTELGDFKDALQANQTAQKYAAYEGKHSTWVNSLKAYEVQICLRQGNIGKASKLIEDLGLEFSDPIKFSRRILIRTFSKYLTYMGQYDPAIQMLAELVEVSKTAGAPIHTMKALILKAVAHHLKGDREGALESLEPALSIAADEGLLVQAFVTEGEPMAQLLYQASSQKIYPEFCNDLLKRFTPSGETTLKSQEGLVEPLSKREIEVLVLIAEGCTNQEIAKELHLSLYTVKSHNHNMYSKLGVKNRTEAVSRAQLLGILTSN